MTDRETFLLIACAAAGIGWIVTARFLVIARREVQEVQQELLRLRSVASPTGAFRTVLGTAIKVKDQGLVGALRSSIDELALWADVEHPELASMAARDGSLTLMFSDIQDSTQLNHRLGDRGWVRLLAKHDRLLNRAIAAHDGRVIKTQGDGFMVAFAEPADAVRAAYDIQLQLSRIKLAPPMSGVRVRIGAHMGSAVQRDGDLFGRNVAYAARVASEARGGEVVVSDSVLAALTTVTVIETREAEPNGIPGTHNLHVLNWRASIA